MVFAFLARRSHSPHGVRVSISVLVDETRQHSPLHFFNGRTSAITPTGAENTAKVTHSLGLISDENWQRYAGVNFWLEFQCVTLAAGFSTECQGYSTISVRCIGAVMSDIPKGHESVPFSALNLEELDPKRRLNFIKNRKCRQHAV